MPLDGLVEGSLQKTPNVGRSRGTTDTAAISLSASSFTTITGTSATIDVPFYVGQKFKFTLGLTKTAAGTATFAVQVGVGTLDTPSDTVVASWTSGTNTALEDRAILIIVATVTAIGSGTSATFSCIAFYANQATDATGLGLIAAAPTTTAGFNSTTAAQYIHVDIEPGTSAVMTAWGLAEKLA